MMDKTGELREGLSKCDLCEQTAIHVDRRGRSRCQQHISDDDAVLKSASAHLVNEHGGTDVSV